MGYEASTNNMMAITIKEFTDEISEQLEEENYSPMLALGKAGVGKTMSIKEFALSHGLGYKELRLANMDSSDVAGVPIITKDGTTAFAANDLLPIASRDGEKGIIVFDEITSCSDDLRAAALQLFDGQRAVGTYKLPDKWKPILLGNGADDGGVFVALQKAVINRCSQSFRIEPDANTWKEWAKTHGVAPTIVAFIAFAPENIYKDYEDDMSAAIATPRSWTALSDLINKREQRRGRKLEAREVMRLSAGAVGLDAGTQFGEFYAFSEKAAELVDPAKVVNGKAVKFTPNGASRKITLLENPADVSNESVYISIQMVAKTLYETLKADKTTKEKQTHVANCLAWLIGLSQIRLDYGIKGVQELLQTEEAKDLAVDDEMDVILPEFVKFCSDNVVVFG